MTATATDSLDRLRIEIVTRLGGAPSGPETAAIGRDLFGKMGACAAERLFLTLSNQGLSNEQMNGRILDRLHALGDGVIEVFDAHGITDRSVADAYAQLVTDQFLDRLEALFEAAETEGGRA